MGTARSDPRVTSKVKLIEAKSSMAVASGSGGDGEGNEDVRGGRRVQSFRCARANSGDLMYRALQQLVLPYCLLEMCFR